MGVVYEAIDERSGARVALKTLKTTSADALLRFKREFRVAQGIVHPNLVGLGELFIDDQENPYFTMELVEGRDFLTHVRLATPQPRDGSVGQYDDTATLPSGHPLGRTQQIFDEARLRDAFAQLARGLAALHAVNCVHRDIKPSNVLVEREGRVVILDFGLITETAANRRSTGGFALGTVGYMAPEQAAARPVGPAADLYSAGVLLYEAMTGSLPFDGSALEVMLKKQNELPKRPSEICEVSPDLDALCMELLSPNPERRPDSATLATRLAGGRKHSLARLRTGADFVGRSIELELLSKFYSRACSGECISAVIQGESGVGKTALVQEFVSTLPTGDALVLSGRCYERETVPFKAIDGIIDALSHYLLQLSDGEASALLPRGAYLLGEGFPVLRRVKSVAAARALPRSNDPLDRRRRLFEAVRELFLRICDRTRLVITIDDLQWADDDSFSLMRELLSPPDPPALFLLGTSRREETRMSSLGAQTIELGPLEDDDARHLATQLLAGDREDTAIAAAVIANESGGHPLFINELVRHASATQGNAAPLQLDEAIARRVSGLDGEARNILAAICVAGTPLRVGAVADVVKMHRDKVAVLAKDLCAQSLARITGVGVHERLEPYHDRVREAVANRLRDDERVRWHERLGDTLERVEDSEPELLATHWRAANQPNRAVEYIIKAADQTASALAFDRASKLYRLALQLIREDDPRTNHLQKRLADSLSNAGRGAEAASQYAALARVASGSEQMLLRSSAAQQYLFSGHVDEGLAQLAPVLKSLNMSLASSPRRALAALLLRRAAVRLRGLSFRERGEHEVAPALLAKIDFLHALTVGLGMVDNIRSADLQSQNLLLALRTGEPKRIARTLGAEAIFSALTTKPSDRPEAILQKAEALARRTGAYEALGVVFGVRGLVAFQCGRYAESLEFSDLGVRTLVDNGISGWMERATARCFAMWSLVRLGRFMELERRMPEALREAEERGDTFFLTSIRTGATCFHWFALDRPDLARFHASDGVERWSHSGTHLQHWWANLSLSDADLYFGDAEPALIRLKRQRDELRRSLLLRIPAVRVDADHAVGRAAVATFALKKDSESLSIAAAAIRRLESEPRDPAAALAAALRSGVASVRGDSNTAVRRLREAHAAFARLQMNLLAGCTARRLAELIAGSEGAEFGSTADRYFGSERIVNPAAMTRTLLPGRFE